MDMPKTKKLRKLKPAVEPPPQTNPKKPSLAPDHTLKVLGIVFLTSVVTATLVGGGMWWWQQRKFQQEMGTLRTQLGQLEVQVRTNLPTLQASVETSATGSPAGEAGWETYRDEAVGYSYQYPSGWDLGTNQLYNGEVELSESSKIYSGPLSFDDGILVTFGFVPQTVADTCQLPAGKCSQVLLNQVKNETDAQAYSNNSFEGWVSMRNSKNTLALIARRQASGGYYEVSALGMGDTQTAQEYKDIIDDVITTFQLTQ